MAMKQPILANGQSVKCSRSDTAVFRYVDGQIRWYPSPDIAASWDGSWGSAIVIDCSRIPRGPDLAAKLPVPARLAEGQAIKCGVKNDEVFRYSGGLRRWYPSPEIASSWDPNWPKWTVVDCTTIPRGADMPRKQLLLSEGQSVKCVGDNVAVYRLVAGSLRLYPSPAIATSWDSNWGNALVIDCSQVARGPDLALKLPPPTRLVEGQSIRCGWDNMEIYRYTGGQRRWYPSEVIASSWDPSFTKSTVVDCSTIPRAIDMPLRAAPPVGDIAEGQTISCRGERERYRYASGLRRLYPTPEVATSWDVNLANFLIVDCSRLPQGADMPFNQIAILEGQTVNCKKGDVPIYRFTNGKIRFYPSPAIASSWEAFWGNPVTIDCTKVPRGPDMALRATPLESLNEGQAVKCDTAQSEVYRFASGQRRWYPSPAIASSWDREWSKPLVVDCTAIPRGPDMVFKQPVLVEGQTVNCNPGDVPIYRYTDGKIRFYPSPAIANSWDLFWGNPTTIDCTKVPRGPDMALRVSPLEKLVEGQSIKCDPNQVEVYRFASGQRRLFLSPEAALSWDPEWTKAVVVDCDAIPRGPDLTMRQPILVEGQTVNCKAGDVPIYRFTEGKIRFYPSPSIANSWDPFWGNPITIDCSKVQRGPDMVLRLSPISRLVEGQSIKCDPGQVEVYRYASGQRRLYLSVAMAASWDSNWNLPAIVDCGAIPRGPDMTMFTPPPPTVREGRAIKCAANQVEVYRYTSGLRRLYPSPAVATSWDMTWPTSAVVVNCNSIPQGEIMPWNIGLIAEGQAVKCSPSETAIYRIQDGKLRWYPSPESATSWEYSWGSAIVIDCSRVPRGPDMPVKLPPIGKLQEGQSIKCSDRASEVFRYTSGLRRFYPSPAIASSWDANWANVVIVDCGLLPRGDDMAFNLGNLPEGQSVKCSNSPTDLTVYRVTDGKLRVYPSVESATSWDFMWGSALPIDCNNIPRGPEMMVRVPPLANLKEGQAIKCAPNQPGVFRYTSGLRRLYPSPAIATSWDINWHGAITVDCTTLPRGDDLTYNVGNLVDGQAIKCADGVVYRFADGQLRVYPSPEAASSWDRLWFSSLSIDCTGIPRGPEMPVRLLPPRGLPEGQSIRCSPWDTELYRFVAGQRRLYPSPSIAASWNPNWQVHLNVDCTSLPRGPNMERNLPIVREGRAIKCNPSEPAIYRYTNGTIRLYPNPPIAASWDPAWARPTVIDCLNVPRGPDMALKLPSPDGLPEGQAIKCDPNEANVYRLTGGQRRWYPNPDIASSWDPQWGNFKVVDCSTLPRGDDMAFFSLAPKDVRDGQAIKCDRGPNVYRYAGGEIRWYPNPPIASSWDSNWVNFVYMDCSKVPRGKDMIFNLGLLSEGQAIKCNPSEPAIYRYTNGTIRLYPNPPIAASWDPAWARPTVIDCLNVPRGPDMALKLPSPDGLPEGQAIKCDPNEANVYRLTGGQRRWYPNPDIASSWDPQWGNFKVVDCSTLPRGDDMAFFSLAPKDVRDGQAIKCDRGPNVYRYAGGEIRWYPNPPIASSWDSNWVNFVYMDCSKVPRGKDMIFNLGLLSEGQAIKCNPSEPAIYRYTNGTIRLYPNPPIAASWDPAWARPTVIDCLNVPRGPDMALKLPSPDGLPEGQAIKCDPNEANVYRLTGGQRRWYPNPDIASSWDPQWGNFKVVDCSTLPRGDDMAFFSLAPKDVRDGQAIKCDRGPNVYRYAGGEIRWYPNPPIASSWDSNWVNFVYMDCSKVPRGKDMIFNLGLLSEGQAIKCNPSEPAIYRYTNGTIRLYPNPPIAASWDPAWARPTVIDCLNVPRGPDMALKLPSPDGLPEGQAIKCDPNEANVYRLTGGQRRWYPNPDIASSWDPQWGNFKVVDCSTLPRGDDMPMNTDGWKQLDGALVQVSYDGRQLCGVNSADDIWCASENIRGDGPTRWRQVPGKLIYVEVYGDVLWGVNRAQQIWVGSSLGDPQWRQLPGSLKQITSDNKQVCGVNANDDIWCANSAIRTNPNWRQVPGKLSFVKLVNGRLVGTSSNGDIFTGRSSGDPAWKQLGGKVRQVTFDGGRLCGTNSNNDVWCADSGLSASPNWSPVPGKRRFVVSNSGEMYSVNDQGGIFYRQM
ncbi:hypothetical protein PINS_up019876 [Pythium insidiosum]|nr:hypothetical protein PINS_up019876 [Pythium insidiosum]